MKGKKIIALVLLALVFSSNMEGKSRIKSRFPFIKYGIEWGGGVSFLEGHRFIYTDPIIGCLMPPDNSTGFSFVPTAYILANLGINMGLHSVLQLESGFCGIHKDRRVFPLQMRYSYHFRACNKDGIFLYGSTGAAFPDNGARRASWLANIGTGWRFSLSRSINLDFLASLKGCIDHPEVWNDELNTYIPHENIRKNDASYWGINIGIGLNF